jgi:hypothetical protein
MNLSRFALLGVLAASSFMVGSVTAVEGVTPNTFGGQNMTGVIDGYRMGGMNSHGMMGGKKRAMMMDRKIVA